ASVTPRCNRLVVAATVAVVGSDCLARARCKDHEQRRRDAARRRGEGTGSVDGGGTNRAHARVQEHLPGHAVTTTSWEAVANENREGPAACAGLRAEAIRWIHRGDGRHHGRDGGGRATVAQMAPASTV